jgi:hypothetical protein
MTDDGGRTKEIGNGTSTHQDGKIC